MAIASVDCVIGHEHAHVSIATPAVTEAVDVSCIYNADMSTGCRITSIAAGLNHNAAMSVAGEIYMWGSNKHGCLGLGDTSNRVLPSKVCFLCGRPQICAEMAL